MYKIEIATKITNNTIYTMLTGFLSLDFFKNIIMQNKLKHTAIAASNIRQ